MIVICSLVCCNITTNWLLEGTHTPCFRGICGVCPYPFTFAKNLFTFFEYSSTSECPSIMNTSCMPNAVVDNEKIMEEIDNLGKKNVNL